MARRVLENGFSGTRTMDIGQTEWMIGEQGLYRSATGLVKIINLKMP